MVPFYVFLNHVNPHPSLGSLGKCHFQEETSHLTLLHVLRETCPALPLYVSKGTQCISVFSTGL